MAAGTRELLAQLVRDLRTVRIDRAMAAARSWLDGATSEDLMDLLAQSPTHIRPKVVTLFSDLLTGVPSILGTPVLVHATCTTTQGLEGSLAHDAGYVLPSELPLPGPRADLTLPREGLDFRGWARNRLQPGAVPSQRLDPYASVAWGTTQAAVALFAYHPEPGLPADAVPTLPVGWWGEVFLPTLEVAAISLSDGPLLPYPEAIEVGSVLSATLGGDIIGSTPPAFFASEATIAAWRQRALTFDVGW